MPDAPSVRPATSLNVVLRSTRSGDLLTPDQERDLARTIFEASHRRRRILSRSLVSAEVIGELSLALARGEIHTSAVVSLDAWRENASDTAKPVRGRVSAALAAVAERADAVRALYGATRDYTRVAGPRPGIDRHLARLRVELGRSVRALALTPAVERALVERVDSLDRSIKGLRVTAADRCGDAWRDASTRLRGLEDAYAMDLSGLQAAARRVSRADSVWLPAHDRMIEANLRLVVSVVRPYSGGPVSLDDLIQEGRLGLMIAVDKFDYRLGYKFSTYASNWITQRALRAIEEQGRLIRLPSHAVRALRRVRAAEPQLARRLGRAPTSGELATHLGLTPATVEAVRQHRARVRSLDEPVGGDDRLCLRDVIEDRGQASPSLLAERASASEAVERALATLTARQRQVLRLRFGLADGARPMTLAEVGTALGISREGVRQIESAGLKRLRHPSRAGVLAPLRALR